MRIKRTLIPLLAFALMGASSYAVAQEYVFRGPASGVKADSSSAVQKEMGRQKQEQENIDMCSSERRSTKYSRGELLNVIDLSKPTFIHNNHPDSDSIGVKEGQKYLYQLVLNGEVARQYRNPSSYSDSTRFKLQVFYGASGADRRRLKLPGAGNHIEEDRDLQSGDQGTYILNKGLSSETAIGFIVGERVLNSNGYKIYFTGNNNKINISQVDVKTTETENYQWCVDNGYETAN